MEGPAYADEVRIPGNAQCETGNFERVHKAVWTLGFEMHGDVNIRREPRTAPDERRLGPEQIPADAQRAERVRECGEQISGRAVG